MADFKWGEGESSNINGRSPLRGGATGSSTCVASDAQVATRIILLLLLYCPESGTLGRIISRQRAWIEDFLLHDARI